MASFAFQMRKYLPWARVNTGKHGQQVSKGVCLCRFLWSKRRWILRLFICTNC